MVSQVQSSIAIVLENSIVNHSFHFKHMDTIRTEYVIPFIATQSSNIFSLVQ